MLFYVFGLLWCPWVVVVVVVVEYVAEFVAVPVLVVLTSGMFMFRLTPPIFTPREIPCPLVFVAGVLVVVWVVLTVVVVTAGAGADGPDAEKTTTDCSAGGGTACSIGT